MDGQFSHKSILLDRCIEYLRPQPGGVFVDGTLGGGGHAEAVLERIQPGGRLIGTDLDDDALNHCRQHLARFGESFEAVKGNFRQAPEILHDMGVGEVSGIMVDLGVSSWQLDEPERGFSYMQDGPLDMRMDRSAARSAWDIVNTYEEKDLARVIRRYGEENFAARIASFIVRQRAEKPIETTGQLSQIITDAIPARYRRQGPHPAKRTFQAIRIEVNGELDDLGQAVSDFITLLGDGGRLCVLSFHSLEDRAVKEAMKTAEDPCVCSKSAPYCVCGKVSQGRMLTRKPETASPEEQEENPRSRSAKLRVFEKRVLSRKEMA